MEMFIIADDSVRTRCLGRIKNVPQGYCIKITKDNTTRSLRQNATMWNWYKDMHVDLGYKTSEELHYTLCREFLGHEKIKDLNGVEFLMPITTKGLNTKQFSEFLEKVKALAEHFDIKIKEPHYTGVEYE